MGLLGAFFELLWMAISLIFTIVVGVLLFSIGLSFLKWISGGKIE
jgi:hypothetical protein